MAVKWTQSHGCDFDFSTMDMDSSEGFDRVVEKVMTDLKMLKELSAEAKTFNSFSKDFPIPTIPEELTDDVKAYFFANDLHGVPYLSKRGMREYSEINFNIELLLPRNLSVVSS